MEIDRRMMLKGLAAGAASLPLAAWPSGAIAQTGNAGGKTLLKGGYVVSMDASIGELPKGDVLIDGPLIAAVGKDLPASDARVIDASSKLVLPGLIDTHRHTWETQLRSMIPEGDFFLYLKVILQTIAPRYRPEDVHIANLVGAVAALNSGITTLLDWSHIMQSPGHADAAVQGLVDSGLRAVFAHGGPVAPFTEWWTPSSTRKHPEDIRRVQKQYFTSQDQLVTMAMAVRGPEFSSLEASVADIKLARELGLRITMHVGTPGPRTGAITDLHRAGVLGPDITHVHTLRCTDDELKMIADTGGTISAAPAVEMMSGHGFPSVQRWLRHGLRPSLSLDNETRMPTDLFTQMRAITMSDRNLEAQRVRQEGGKPKLIPVRDVLSFATVEGARVTGLDRKVGTLAPGKRADIIMLDLTDISLIPINDPVSTAVLIASPAAVTWVFVDGKVKKQDGKLVGVDVDRLRRMLQASRDHLVREGDVPKS